MECGKIHTVGLLLLGFSLILFSREAELFNSEAYRKISCVIGEVIRPPDLISTLTFGSTMRLMML